MKNASIAVLVSAGIDSSILLKLVAEQYSSVYPIFVAQGLVWEPAEQFWLNKLLTEYFQPRYPSIQPLTLLQLPLTDLYPEHWSLTGKHVPDWSSPDEAVYLPGRNIFLLAKAATFCAKQNIPEIALGVLKGNPFPDSARTFFDKFEDTLTLGLSHSIRILTPFLNQTKAEVVSQAGDLPLERTFSCLNPQPNYQPCHACNKCAEREKIVTPFTFPIKCVGIRGSVRRR